jgi:hypothetical protein
LTQIHEDGVSLYNYLVKNMGFIEKKKISPKEYFEKMTPCPIPNTYN